MLRRVFVVATIAVTSLNAGAYGPRGHAMVGALADKLLAHSGIRPKLTKLIGKLSLSDVATIPDVIKSWDRNPVDTSILNAPGYRELRPQLWAFWQANHGMPSHGQFHYTDVPISGTERYATGHVGRNPWDIVHMIDTCIAVLRGTLSEQNPRAITKPVAVVLLAHYVGDIHQPLHVGAAYFSAKGRQCNPDKGGGCFGDEGGNAFSLTLSDNCEGAANRDSLHKFWDNDAAKVAFPTDVADTTGCNPLPTVDPATCAQQWADEILPIAREAHMRLTFSGVHVALRHGTQTATGSAIEKPAADGVCYKAWAASVAKSEIRLAGKRLAALLEAVVK